MKISIFLCDLCNEWSISFKCCFWIFDNERNKEILFTFVPENWFKYHLWVCWDSNEQLMCVSVTRMWIESNGRFVFEAWISFNMYGVFFSFGLCALFMKQQICSIEEMNISDIHKIDYIFQFTSRPHLSTFISAMWELRSVFSQLEAPKICLNTKH